MIVALLCGRGSSKGVKNKNIYPILGRPLMVYPLMAAKNSRYIEYIYLSTDSEQIKAVGKEYSVRIVHRPDYLATDDALLEDALVHGYNYIKHDLKKDPEIIVILLCNAATITSDVIDKGIEILLKDADKDIDSCVTVALRNQFNPIRAKKIVDGYLEPLMNLDLFEDVEDVCDRKCMGDVYFCDASLWVIRNRCMNIEHGIVPYRWMGRKTIPLIQEGGLDVDAKEDLVVTEFWLKKHGFTDTKTPYRENRIKEVDI